MSQNFLVSIQVVRKEILWADPGSSKGGSIILTPRSPCQNNSAGLFLGCTSLGDHNCSEMLLGRASGKDKWWYFFVVGFSVVLTADISFCVALTLA